MISYHPHSQLHCLLMVYITRVDRFKYILEFDISHHLWRFKFYEYRKKMGKSVGLKQCEVWHVSSFQLLAFKLSATWSNYFFISPFVFKKDVMAHMLTRPWTLQRKSWMLQYHFLNQMSQHYVTSWIIIYGEIQHILNHKLKNSKSKAPPAVLGLWMENQCILQNHFLNQMSQHQLHTFWTLNSKFTCLSLPPRHQNVWISITSSSWSQNYWSYHMPHSCRFVTKTPVSC